jgi:hypothetical protein
MFNAICQYLSSAADIYWLRSPGTGGSFFGTYVNRDHYAGLMEMLTPFALVLSLSRPDPWRTTGAGYFRSHPHGGKYRAYLVPRRRDLARR